MRPRLYQDKLDRVAALAARIDGVSNKEVQADLGCCVKIAAALLHRATLYHDLVVARTPGVRQRAFTTTHAARTWLQKKVACLQATQRAMERAKQARAEAAKAAAQLKALQRTQAKEQRDEAKLQAGKQRLAARLAKRAEAAAAKAQARAAAAKPAPWVERAKAAAAKAQAKSATAKPAPWVECAKATRFDSGPRARDPLPLTAAQRFAQAEPVVTPDTKHTVIGSAPPHHRVNRMADPLPAVPGWASTGPAIRAGALDFKRYQHHGPLATLAGKGGL